MLWQEAPDTVSRGAQKNFAEFAKRTGPNGRRTRTRYNELFYRHLIARAIVFQKTERIVSEQPWYAGGYRAEIVAYAIAKLSYDLSRLKKSSIRHGGEARRFRPTSMRPLLWPQKRSTRSW